MLLHIPDKSLLALLYLIRDNGDDVFLKFFNETYDLLFYLELAKISEEEVFSIMDLRLAKLYTFLYIFEFLEDLLITKLEIDLIFRFFLVSLIHLKKRLLKFYLSFDSILQNLCTLLKLLYLFKVEIYRKKILSDIHVLAVAVVFNFMRLDHIFNYIIKL